VIKNMVKKIIALAGAGAMLLSMATPALGTGWWWWGSDRNTTIVRNDVLSVADTGGNTQDNVALVNRSFGVGAHAGSMGNRDIDTGDARAYAESSVEVYTDTGCTMCSWLRPSRDYTEVTNIVGAGAYTGDNHQDNYASVNWSTCSDAGARSWGERDIGTGNATSTAKGWTVVGAHVMP
jgi:hypothetical protein